MTPQLSGQNQQGQSNWLVYVTSVLIVSMIMLVVNTPLIIVLIGIAISTPTPFAIAFWLGLIGVPIILLDIWLIRWLKDNIQVLRWTNQRQRRKEKGDRLS